MEVRLHNQNHFFGNAVITGRITSYLPSGGPFVRMDSHIYPDYVVPPSYDSLLGKVCLGDYYFYRTYLDQERMQNFPKFISVISSIWASISTYICIYSI